VEVAEAAGDPAMEFDHAVDGLGTAVVGPAGGEVGQELGLPGTQGAAEACDLGDGAGVESLDNLGRDGSSFGQALGVVGRPELLVAAPGDGDLKIRVAGLQTGMDPFELAVGEPLNPGTESVADLVERVVFAAAVAELFLLDPAAGLLHRGESELDHMDENPVPRWRLRARRG
jgi:hypothetical protein